jgi:hypothetical protein
VHEIEDQLRAYGEALERAATNAVAAAGGDRREEGGRRRAALLAAAAVVLVAVAAWGLLSSRPGRDDLRTQSGPTRPTPADQQTTAPPSPETTPSPATPPPAPDPAGGPETESPPLPSTGTPTGERPGPGNTGPSDRAALVPMTAEQVEALMRPGAVIEHVAITGGNLDVMASDVTLRNFTLDARGAAFGVRSCGPDADCGTPADQTTGLVLEDGEIYGMATTGFWGREAALRRLDVHDSGSTALRPLGDVTIEASWWHHVGLDGGTANGVLFGEAGGRNVTIRGNHCDLPASVAAPYGSSSCVIAGTGSPDVTVTVEDNWLTGGNNTVECNGHPSMSVVGNRFGRDLRYRPVSRCPTAADNVWDDTGEPI